MTKEFQIIVAGCGGMAHMWTEYATGREDTEVVGLVDISEENANKLAEKFKLQCDFFPVVDQAIEKTGANLVFDISIPEAHHDIVTKALKAGCNVLGEKPMAASMEQAIDMVNTARQTGKTYAVMQNRRYLKQIRAYRDLIASGTIGQPGFVCADFFLGPHFGGFRDVMESPLLLDMAIHSFDQARFITGADAVSVYCHDFNPPGSWYKGNAASVCIFEMSDGSVFCYRGSWCAEGCQTSWECDWRITGSKGTAVWDGFQMPYAEVVTGRPEGSFASTWEKVEGSTSWDDWEGHGGCLNEMFAALKNGTKPGTDCEDNIKSVAMMFGAVESARRGEKIPIKV